MVDEENDVRIVGLIAMFFLLFVALIGGMKWENRTQIVLLVVLIIALINFFIGTCLPPTDDKRAHGYTGFSFQTMKGNTMSDYRGGETFGSIFAVFFPAATGILAGANISGDLRDPARAIPTGTITAIIISTSVYIATAVLLGMVMLRDANGFNPSGAAAGAGELTVNATNSSVDYVVTAVAGGNATFKVPSINATEYVFSPENVANCSLVPEGCKFGLHNDYQAMKLVSGFGYLVTAGIIAATLSSALASMVSAPKVFQAVCKDEIFKKLNFFARTSPSESIPRRAFVLTFLVGLACALVGNLNIIAPFISMFFLATYALINFSCFHAAFVCTPGWRPLFRYYNKWVSLLGCMICIVVMFVIHTAFALSCCFIIGFLFLYVKHVSKPDVNWGSSVQALVYLNALKFSLRLLRTEDHIKNYKPQVLVLTGDPENRPALVDFVSHITKDVGLMVCGHVIVGQQSDYLPELLSLEAYNFFRTRKAKSFYSCTVAPGFRNGVQNLMQNVGIGKLRPDVLLMGFKSNWNANNVSPQSVYQYFCIIHDAFDLHFGVGILRMKEGLGMGLDETTYFNNPNDPTPPPSDDEQNGSDTEQENNNIETPLNGQNNNQPLPNGQNPLNGMGPVRTSSTRQRNRNQNQEMELEQRPIVGGGGAAGPINTEVIRTLNRFSPKKTPTGTIDVWWLYDDGGLTLLIPHLLRVNAWKKCTIRVFVPGSKHGDLNQAQRELVGFMQKFRLGTKHVHVLSGINKPPREESMRTFNSYMDKWILKEDEGETHEEFPWKSSPAELSLLKDKTKRHVRVKELLEENSKKASLIVLTLPMPRKGTCSAGLYMAWLDHLTKDLPPMLLLRGNQQSVLTFYS